MLHIREKRCRVARLKSSSRILVSIFITFLVFRLLLHSYEDALVVDSSVCIKYLVRYKEVKRSRSHGEGKYPSSQEDSKSFSDANENAGDQMGPILQRMTHSETGSVAKSKSRGSAIIEINSPTSNPNVSIKESQFSLEENIKTGEQEKTKDKPISDVDMKRSRLRRRYLRMASENVAMYRREHPELSSYYNAKIPLLPQQTKGVVILTNYRSGSTIFGELFNQHPESFYSFEPLYLYTADCHRYNDIKVDIMRKMLKCDFPDVAKMYEKVQPLPEGKTETIDFLKNNFSFRWKTAELCDKTFCPYGFDNLTTYCGPVHLPRAMNICRSKQLSVVKVIRICKIEDLRPILEDPTMDIKIIHLVRDPRGSASSKLKLDDKSFSFRKVIVSTNETCWRALDNGVRGLSNTSESTWINGKYKRIRYEDFALKPLSIAEIIYDFVGLHFYPHLKKWFENTTKAEEGSLGEFYSYQTKRNSKTTMQAWRNHLSLNQVLTIQKLCSDMMKHFGYKMVFDEANLRNTDENLF